MKIRVYFIIALICILITAGLRYDVYAATSNVTRIGGTDRYDTAIKISQASFSSSNYVILVSGENFPDALSAVTLAGKYGAPILLTQGNSLESNVLQEIMRLGAKNIIIVGGTGVVSLNIEQQLTSNNINVTRIAGKDRYETSEKVAEVIGTQNGAVITSGENYPDALSIASIAAKEQMPILLTTANSLPSSINSFIQSSSISKFYVVGGLGVVSDNVVKGLNNVVRLGGQDRYQTNLAVLNQFINNVNLSNLYVATGEDFADALGGAAAAANKTAPILLTDQSDFTNQTFVEENYTKVNNYIVLGGTGAVSDAVVQKLMNSAGKLVLGYATYYYNGDNSSYNSMSVNYSNINEIATDTYSVDGSGKLTGLIPTSQISFANNNKMPVYAMLTNAFDASMAKTMLESETNRQNAISNTLAALKANNFSGVNVDIEGIYYYDRSYFTTFISELSTALHSQGYTLTLALPAKTQDDLTDGWSGGYDYTQLGSLADQVVIMTYDFHWIGGSAGAIAPIDWVQNVVNYAATVIPKNKILLGVAAYGYDWASDGNNKAYGVSQAYSVAANNNAAVQWDDTSKSPYYNYTVNGVQHSVWFENSSSLSYKLDIVNNSNLAGIAIWRLGLEDSNYWTTIKNKIN